MSPELSIVVAVQGGAWRLPEVLAALEPQVTAEVEVLVCHAGEEAGVAEACAGRPWARVVEGGEGALIPLLWRDGIDAARGSRVALTIVHCRPGPGWVEGLLAADLSTYVGVGGSLENDPASDRVGWAIYLLRYRRYAPPFEARETADLAGDNIVYDRRALVDRHEDYRDGFWENEVHELLQRGGGRLLLDPSLRVVHANGYSVRGFTRQRFLHGIRFGLDRGRRMGLGRRFVQLLAAPLVPAVFGLRIVREASRHPDLRGRLPGALPWLGLFLLAWAAGEARGTLAAFRRSGAGG